MIVTNITKGKQHSPMYGRHGRNIAKDATHETMVQEFAKKNGTSGTCGEMTPLLFLYQPKIQNEQHHINPRIFLPQNIYNMLNLELGCSKDKQCKTETDQN